MQFVALQSGSSLFRHPKVRRLAVALELDQGRSLRVETVGRLAALWTHCAGGAAEDGIINTFDPEDVAEAMGFDASRGKEVYSAMAWHGWIDPGSADTVLHDWLKYQGAVLAKRFLGAKSEQAKREWESIVRRHEKAAAEAKMWRRQVAETQPDTERDTIGPSIGPSIGVPIGPTIGPTIGRPHTYLPTYLPTVPSRVRKSAKNADGRTPGEAEMVAERILASIGENVGAKKWGKRQRTRWIVGLVCAMEKSAIEKTPNALFAHWAAHRAADSGWKFLDAALDDQFPALWDEYREIFPADREGSICPRCGFFAVPYYGDGCIICGKEEGGDK